MDVSGADNKEEGSKTRPVNELKNSRGRVGSEFDCSIKAV